MDGTVRWAGRIRTLLVLAVFGASVPAVGAAHARPVDARAWLEARAAIDTDCDCAGAPTHRTYVRCAKRAVDDQIDRGLLDPGARRDVLWCAKASTCGLPGAVACCRMRPDGRSGCRIKSDPRRCRSGRRVEACASASSSCCDACDGASCEEPTTQPTPTTTVPIREAAGEAGIATDLRAETRCSTDVLRHGEVVLHWSPATPRGSAQRIEITAFRDGFETGRLMVARDVDADAQSTSVGGLEPGLAYRWRVLSRQGEEWLASEVASFVGPTCVADFVEPQAGRDHLSRGRTRT